jgi:putative membrane protein
MLPFITNIGILIIAIMHLWFLVLEMFLWQKPLGLKVFGMDTVFASQTAALAANQGLYNGFLCAGLIWSLLSANDVLTFQLKIFFLSCITVAGIYGGLSVNRKIFFVQACPALLVLALLFS